jgi:hypothetical protein
MENEKKDFLVQLIEKEEYYSTKFLEKKVQIDHETSKLISELKEKYEKIWNKSKTDIDRESYIIEKKESTTSENLLWENYYELLSLKKKLETNSDKTANLLIDFFLKGGKISD